MGTAQPPDQSMLVYKIETLERIVAELRQQLQNYVLAREHDLQLKQIQSTVDRIEREITAAKNELTALNTKLIENEVEAQKRDAAQRESQDKLQIRVLWGIVSTIITLVVLLLVAYFTHVIR